ncbi:MAG: serine/threonine-protein kinase [Myxococcota bacterium]|nr:serine/threonine-protein kinase [Myxococcota bacterium]
MSRWRPGEQVADRFIIEGWLASGGMAEVYVAEMELARGVKKRVALKRIHTHLAEDQHFLTMFIDEARLASQLSHPGIIAVHDVVETDGEVILVLDYVPGWDLSSVLKSARRNLQQMPIGMAISIGVDLAETLSYVHEARSVAGTMLNIVHRDVNPSNILVARDGTIRLLDFGVAKASERLQQTATASIKGKLAYLAPEQANIGALVDHRADLYGLGLILYEVITGQRAIYGEGDLHLLEMAKAPQHKRVDQLRAETPQALVDIVSQLLAVDPNERYQHGRDVANDLEPLRSSVTDTHRESICQAVRSVMRQSSRPLRKPSKPKVNPLDLAFAEALGGLDKPRPKTKPLSEQGRNIAVHENEPEQNAFHQSSEPDQVSATQSVRIQNRKERRRALVVLGAAVFTASFALVFYFSKGTSPETKALDRVSIPVTTYLKINSDPAGAEIFLDGQSQTQTTPAVVPVDADREYRIRLALKGYKPFLLTQRARAGEPNNIEGKLVPLPGSFKLMSDPSGARVKVDGIATGTTPISMDTLQRKKYRLTVHKEGYSPADFTIDLATTHAVEKKIQLRKILEYGRLDVSSRPWAKVYIDGKVMAETTPAFGIKVEVGRRTVRFENPRLNKSMTKQVMIRKGETSRLVVDLR